MQVLTAPFQKTAPARPIRVLMLSHGCQSRSEGQPRAVLLGKMKDIQLRVLTPTRWNDYGTWREPQDPIEQTFDLKPLKVRFPWAGPAQWYLHYYPGLAKELREFQPDVIDVWEEPWSLAAAHVCRLRDSAAPSARIVVETEQNIFKRLPPPFRQFRNYVLRHTDSMIGRSRESIEVLRRHGYLGSAHILPNAVETQLFHPLDRSESRRAIRAETGVDWSDRFIVGFAGRVVIQKGIIELIEAIAKCPDPISLLVVGTGSAEAEVKELVAQLNLSKRVLFLPPRPLDRLPELFSAMDVLAVPSRTTSRWKEQFGRVIIEAHAVGIPVIGSSSGAIPDVIGEGGIIVPEQDPVELARKVTYLSDNPSVRDSLGIAGLHQVQQSYSWDAVTARLREIYFDLLESLPVVMK